MGNYLESDNLDREFVTRLPQVVSGGEWINYRDQVADLEQELDTDQKPDEVTGHKNDLWGRYVLPVKKYLNFDIQHSYLVQNDGTVLFQIRFGEGKWFGSEISDSKRRENARIEAVDPKAEVVTYILEFDEVTVFRMSKDNLINKKPSSEPDQIFLNKINIAGLQGPEINLNVLDLPKTLTDLDWDKLDLRFFWALTDLKE